MDNELLIKTVGQISEKFIVPSYQRGYRWTEGEVSKLLNDIYESGKNSKSEFYWLQPVVVCDDGDRAGYLDLIDGQQRLTTIYLIYKYIQRRSLGFYPEPKFTIEYATRPQSAAFLKNLDENVKDCNIDFYYMWQAYETVSLWFERREQRECVSWQTVIANLCKFFDEHVKIIWYKVTSEENPEKLFTRLNIGKIELNCAELVKAMFMSSGSVTLGEDRRNEIALQWDEMEKDLRNPSFWAFLSNREYVTRIELILDIISQKGSEEHEKHYTFFKFDEMRKKNGGNLTKIWDEIVHTYLELKNWYEDGEYYHKIGYLIASGSQNLKDIYNKSKNLTKTQFKQLLDGLIKDSVKIGVNYGLLDYNKQKDYDKISKLLLLFNVISVNNSADGQRFPFDKFKNTGRAKWSLEHIHAQNSEGLKRDVKLWREWLKYHLNAIKRTGDDGLLMEMRQAVDGKLDENKFNELRDRVVGRLSAKGDVGYLHTIANLALLDTATNAALNNSVFAAKRDIILQNDRNGQFIPFCTRNVFLKYYTPAENNQLDFWGEEDRKAYISEINKVLETYLDGNEIVIGENEDD